RPQEKAHGARTSASTKAISNSLPETDKQSKSGTFLSDIEFEEKLEAFVVECEGQDPNNLDTELIDHFDHFSLKDNESETFLTACGKMTESNAFKTAHQLSQKSTKHAITRTVTQFKLEADNRISTLESRYDSSIFYGILIDTGAAGYSTAGYKQYQAFITAFRPYPINTSEKI
ncbi:hypothetical protein GcC1_028037, partial [Golovinomyces cichoracearum]